MTAQVATRDKDLFAIYLKDIGRHSLLSRDEEVQLAQLIEEGQSALEALEQSSDLEPDQTRWLQRAVRRGDDARQTFVESNLRLVVTIAMKYRASGVPMLDLVQEGNIGLIHAVGKFDWRMGFKFSTYASWWIRQGVERGVEKARGTIRVPRQIGQVAARVIPMRAELEAQLGRPGTYAELAEALSVTEERLTSVLRSAHSPMSLSEPLTDGGASLDEVIADPVAESPLDAAAAASMPGAVEKLLAPLDERERKVISLRFGLDRGEPRTLAEVATFFSLTRERIRQIEMRALSNLRKAAAETDLRDLMSG